MISAEAVSEQGILKIKEAKWIHFRDGGWRAETIKVDDGCWDILSWKSNHAGSSPIKVSLNVSWDKNILERKSRKIFFQDWENYLTAAIEKIISSRWLKQRNIELMSVGNLTFIWHSQDALYLARYPINLP